MTTRGGRRQGGGRRAKLLIELVEAGSFSVTRHSRLLWSDTSLLEAAAARPEDASLQRLAEIQRLCRWRGSRDSVLWFARALRELKVEEAKVMAKPHTIEVVESWEDGERVITARNPGRDEPFMTLRTASLCPNCVSTALRDVLELYEADARVAR